MFHLNLNVAIDNHTGGRRLNVKARLRQDEEEEQVLNSSSSASSNANPYFLKTIIIIVIDYKPAIDSCLPVFMY